MAAPALSRYLVMGRIAGAHGLRGWVAVQSYADPPEALLQYREWRLRAPHAAPTLYRLRESKWDGHRMRVAFEEVQDRTAAQGLGGCEIEIERTGLPTGSASEYYCDDLLGFAVRNLGGALLGTVQYFVETPAHMVMVVRGEREYWLPVTPQHLRRVELAMREVEVDWPADF